MGEIEYGSSDVNRMKWQIYEKLPYFQQRVAVFYADFTEGNAFLGENARSELRAIADALHSCAVLFHMDPVMKEKCRQFKKADVFGSGRKEQPEESLFVNLFEVLEETRAYINQKIKHCNVCKNEVFFTPIPMVYEAMRRKCGFPYWDADFQLESKENYGCPVCGAYDRDRLMIAFLEEVRGEGEEKLKMLQIAPTLSIERYALGREDILYESTDLMRSGVTFQADLQHMDMVEDNTYDIVICSHVLEHVENDVQAMGELHRILKPDGVCLVLVPLIVGKQGTEEQWGCGVEENWRRFGQGDHSRLYGKEDFIGRLQKAGFYVNELGKEWFGEEFYRICGFDDLSILYAATKGIRLTGAEPDV